MKMHCKLCGETIKIGDYSIAIQAWFHDPRTKIPGGSYYYHRDCFLEQAGTEYTPPGSIKVKYIKPLEKAKGP